jgi:hypothetical protein
MANADFASNGVNDEIIARNFIRGYTSVIAPLAALSTSFSADAARPGDTIKVIRDATAIDAVQTKSIGGAYTIQDCDADKVDIELGTPKYVSWSLDDVEVARASGISIELFGFRKGNALAKSIMQDILGLVTNTNYGAAAFTGAASTFDEDDVADIAKACDDADIPEENRVLMLSNGYIAALRKSGAIKDTSGYGYNAIMSGDVPMLHGFRVIKSNIIPANSENLVGFACDPAAILAAFRYNAPQSGHKYTRAEPIVGEGGITLGLRDWYDENSGTRRMVMEAIYGKTVGIAAGLKRLVSA